MARLSRKLRPVGEPVRQGQTARAKRRVQLSCCLALACGVLGLLACEEPSNPGFFTEPAPLPIADDPLYDPDSFKRHRLDNGLRTIVSENPAGTFTTLAVRVRRGAGSVDPSRAGLAQFTAALLQRGAGDRDARTLTLDLGKLSGILEIDAKWDAITLKISGPAEHLDRFVEILADLAMRAHLEEDELERTARLLITKIRNSGNRPRGLLRRFSAQLLYPNHRAGIRLTGTEATVSAIQIDDVRNFYSEIFVPNNALFFATGAFDADELLTLVTEAFGAWAPGPMPKAPPPLPSPAPDSHRVLIVDRPALVRGTHVLLAHDGIARQSPDQLAARLLNKVVEQSAILSTQSQMGMQSGGGTYRLSTITHSSKVRRVIDLLLAELERARTRPISETELERARSLVSTRFSRSLATSNAVLSALVELDTYDLPEDSITTFRSRLRAIRATDLEQQARRLLHPDRAAIILIGPAERLVPQLDGLGPIEVVQYPPVPETHPEADDDSPAADDDSPAGEDDPPARPERGPRAKSSGP